MTGSLITTSFIQGILIISRNVSLNQAGERARITKVKESMFIDTSLVRPWQVRAGRSICQPVDAVSQLEVFPIESSVHDRILDRGQGAVLIFPCQV